MSCRFGLLTLLASEVHREDWNYKKTDSSNLEESLHLLAGRRRYLKANQFSEHISISDHIYRWIYVDLIKSLKQRTAAAVGKTALATCSNDLV